MSGISNPPEGASNMGGASIMGGGLMQFGSRNLNSSFSFLFGRAYHYLFSANAPIEPLSRYLAFCSTTP